MAGTKGHSGKKQFTSSAMTDAINARLNSMIGDIEQGLRKEIESSLKEVRDKAASGMQNAYSKELADEGDTLNKDVFPIVVRPEDGIKSSEIKISSETTQRRVRISGSVLDVNKLDKIDRKNGTLTVNILIKSKRGQFSINGVPCAVKEITLKGRKERSKGRSFTTWRALEYGGAVSGLTRVRARVVESINEGLEGTTVTYGPTIVFMTRRGSWWRKVSSGKLGNLYLDSKGDIYWGGSHPIGNAVRDTFGTGGQQLSSRVSKIIREAMK